MEMVCISGSAGVTGGARDAAYRLSPGASGELQPCRRAERVFAADRGVWPVRRQCGRHARRQQSVGGHRVGRGRQRVRCLRGPRCAVTMQRSALHRMVAGGDGEIRAAEGPFATSV